MKSYIDKNAFTDYLESMKVGIPESNPAAKSAIDDCIEAALNFSSADVPLADAYFDYDIRTGDGENITLRGVLMSADSEFGSYDFYNRRGENVLTIHKDFAFMIRRLDAEEP